MKILNIALQLIFFLVFSPLLSGLITRIKNNLRLRRGQGILQPYYNCFKLFAKEDVVSETASWIYRATPFIVLSSTLTAALLVPVFSRQSPLHQAGDFLALIFIFALGRFFLALSALDTSSVFGGMGSSREMFISAIAEPVVCMVIFVLSLHPAAVASLIGAIALLFVVIAETSRLPVDNQETHLELTMVHEAMVLEYSGKSLALLELAAAVKQMVWFSLFAWILLPLHVPYAAAIAIAILIVAFIEVSLAKMRLLRVVDYFAFAFLLSIIAAVCAIMEI